MHFKSDTFLLFNDLVETKSESIRMKWVSDLNEDNLERLYFESLFVSTNDWCTTFDPNDIRAGRVNVTRSLFKETQLAVENVVIEAARSLDQELSTRFSAHNVMDASSVVFPQYWLTASSEEAFPKHLTVLQNAYCHPKS